MCVIVECVVLKLRFAVSVLQGGGVSGLLNLQRIVISYRLRVSFTFFFIPGHTSLNFSITYFHSSGN